MKMTSEEILTYISCTSYHPVKTRELAHVLKVPEENYRQFRQLVRELVASGELVRIRGGRIGLPKEMNLKIGRIQITSKGFAFLTPEGEKGEIYVSSTDVKTALNGDKVVVRIKPTQSGSKPEGEVIKVLERARQLFVGTYHRAKYFEYIEPDDPSFKRDIYLHPDHGLFPQEGQKVAVILSEWKNQFLNPEGKLVEILGHPHEAGVDILSIIKKFNLPTSFPTAVELEAANVPAEISSDERQKRVDLRERIVFTIDPSDAKDHDDAVSVERTAEGNYSLGVHIADVSHYVREGSALDREARERACSVYLVDRVLPMLPERLSNGICSLKENEERLSYSCQIEITPRGKVLSYKIFKSLIRSRARLSYDQVQDYFDSGQPVGFDQDVAEKLTLMCKLAKLMRSKRLASGSLDFDLPEPLVVLDKSGEVIDIRTRPRKESHRLVEEFMLLANRCVAEYFLRLGLPTLYRVHDVPDPEKIEAFREFAKTLGYELKLTNPVKPKQLADFLNSVEGKPEEELLNELLLRSLKKAMYQPDNIGHFGLAYDHYLHFTSPIRRYPDLMVHRLLAEITHRHYPAQRTQTIRPLLEKLGPHCTDMEIMAEKAERETIKVKQVIYLSKHLGDVFEGIISGMTSGGFFVRLLKFNAEGMVRLSSLNDDYYLVNLERHVISGRHTKKRYRLGDKIFVQIMSVDLVFYRVDLRLIEDQVQPVRADRSRKKRRRG